ncbi:armadillo-type protein [Pilaira anomala]|nr:armadillo-type protein [Pilaira anomala]
MEKLLQWAVNNTDQDALSKQAEAIRRGEAKPDPSKYDPKVLEAILGKDDATRMKDAVACISDPEDTVQNKEIALDNLELLIEGIDNACNIENMKLWPAIIEQLESEHAPVRKGTAWVCGTAVQNNPKAQKAFLEHGGLKPLLSLLKDEDKMVRNKAQYAISGFLKHHQAGVDAFKALNGFEALHDILKSPTTDPAMLRKVVFLYNSLVFDDEALSKELVKNGTLDDLIKVLVKYTKEEEDEDMVEKALRTIHSLLVKSKTNVSAELKQHVQEAKEKYGAENLGLADSEWKDLL